VSVVVAVAVVVTVVIHSSLVLANMLLHVYSLQMSTRSTDFLLKPQKEQDLPN
jgi:hypothetical protein